MSKSDKKNEKLVEIQFLRVIAIFSVVIFHFTARRANELPYGRWVSGTPWSLGWLGVQLFFIVSGFVIAFSLQNISTVRTFLIHRATRIYPALILLLPFVFVVQRFTPNSPYADRSTVTNLVGSITLIPPTVLNFFSDSGFDWLTLVLWSLKVEVFFYLLCALIFATLGKSKLPTVLTVFSVVANLILVLQSKFDVNALNLIAKAIKVFGFEHLSWFVIGILIFELRFKSKASFMKIGLTITSVSTLLNLYILNDYNPAVFLGGVALLASALLFALFRVVKNFPLKKYILMIGDSSYEMYLVHQGVGLTLLIYVANRFDLGPISGALAGLLLISATTNICHFIFTRITKPINSWARSALSRKWYKPPLNMVQNYPMRLDHVSYVTSHDQLADTVQRLGSRLGTTFVDGGIHPRFGTRNFTAPLLDGKYIEVVCPLDHPATEQTPWGKAVSKKAQEGGGWLTWVFSTEDISPIEEKFGRKAVDGHRTRPDGTDLKWKQIGVKEIEESRELPFFIEWLTDDHPSKDGNAVAKIEKIVFSNKGQLADSWFKDEIFAATEEVSLNWIDLKDSDSESGIVAVHLLTPNGSIVLE